MDKFVWALQIALALFFIAPAFMKLKTPKQQLIEQKRLAPDGSVVPIRVIGWLEVLGCVGIILPVLLGILPVLTPIAAIGFALVMIGAVAVHYKKAELKVIPMLVLAFIAAVYVAWYRFGATLS
jgi:uncharacterized membrane protein YphA (DoxX/SURF4 family)